VVVNDVGASVQGQGQNATRAQLLSAGSITGRVRLGSGV